MQSTSQHSSEAGKVHITYREAVRDALRECLRDHKQTFLMGEDVGEYGGCYAVSQGLLEEFGHERVWDTPLSESGFVGIGIGAALAGMRPIIEVMTCNFSLLCLDQIVNSAATLRHMSGGQMNVPIVIRMATGAGRQLAAQHSHSFEGWYAHIPGLMVLTPATIDDARYMLPAAVQNPDPVLIFENASLYNAKGVLNPANQDFDPRRAMVRRPGEQLTIITYGGSLAKSLSAAEQLAEKGISAEVLDLRCLRPLDEQSILDSVRKTRRVVIVDEGWRSGGISAEIATRIAEHCFYDLDAPPLRVCTEEVPIPYPEHLEHAALPQTEKIFSTALQLFPGEAA